MKPVSVPFIKRRDFFLIQSHYFKDIIDYLNFFKKEDGSWISSKGFFFGISFTLFFILEEELFQENKNIIIQRDLPFNDFSLEENGLFFKFSLNSDEEKYDMAEMLHVYSTPNGHLPIFELISSKLNQYFKNIFRLYELIEETLPFEKRIKELGIHNIQTIINGTYKRAEENFIQIATDSLKKIQNFLTTIPNFQENYTLANIFDFENIYAYYYHSQIRDNKFFEILSSGILTNFKNWKDKIRIIVFHIVSDDIQNNFMKIDIKTINNDFRYHFLNQISDLDNEILYGYFIEIPALSEKRDHTFWIGSPIFGGNKRIPTSINLQNYHKLQTFCQDNINRLEIKSYLVKRDIVNEIIKKNEFNFDQPSPFYYFFNSGEEIEDTILLNNYRQAFKIFIRSFEGEIVSSQVKGRALENLTEKLFNMIPGFRVAGMNVETEAEEIDLVVEINSNNMDILEILGTIFIVECKNRIEKVSSEQITSFKEKIKIKKLRGGVIISREGFTGQSQDKSAKRKIRDCIIEDIVILTLEKNDLEKINEGVNPLYFFRKSYYNTYFRGLK